MTINHLFSRLSTLLACWLTLALSAQAQSNLLQSGPMLGYSDMREVMLWVQTNAPAQVHFKYYEQEQEGKNKVVYRTVAYQTKKEEAYTAHLVADEVQPGKTYNYELYINNKKVSRPYPLTFQSQKLFQYRTDPPTIRFAIGSCSFVNEEQYDRPGRGYGSNYGIFHSIHEKKPDFMLWLGDNIYLREPDWGTQTGVYHRYTHTRSLPELQPLLASTHHYAIWDDHDYGPNDSDRSFPNKKLTEATFKLFWANPNYDLTSEGGITGTFEWGDLAFFLLDNRYHRAPNKLEDPGKDLIGEKQIQWLIESLINSRAPFKFVAIGGQFLNPAKKYENHSTFPIEREKILQAIRDADIKGVIFLDGDRHHTELTKMERYGTYPLYDFTCSPLTAGTGRPDEENYMRVEGTDVKEHNFAMLEVTGPRKQRELKITVYDTKGSEIWSRSFNENDLRYAERKN